jgi:hypothetical protein
MLRLNAYPARHGMPFLPATDVPRRYHDGTPESLPLLSANRYGWAPTTIPLPDEAPTPHSGLDCFPPKGAFLMGLFARSSSPVNAGSPFEGTKGKGNDRPITRTRAYHRLHRCQGRQTERVCISSCDRDLIESQGRRGGRGFMRTAGTVGSVAQPRMGTRQPPNSPGHRGREMCGRPDPTWLVHRGG